MSDEIKVSIYTLTYNHGKYIRDCLEGIVNQKTNFRFELIIHDDASTDDTADIIREYEKKYPDIIKPIYETENQRSKGIKYYKAFFLPNANGKYVAYCEGDDYWVDPQKLQKQFDYMESHQDCSFCFTNAKVIDLLSGEERLFIPWTEKDKEKINNNCDCDFNLAQLASIYFIPTASFFHKIDDINKFPDYYDDWCFGGDRKLACYYTALGYAHYIKDVTCAYRYNVPNSALTRKKSISERYKIQKSFLNLNENLNRFTDYKYDEYFEQAMFLQKRNLLILSRTFSVLKDKSYRKAFASLSPKDKVRYILYAVIPNKISDKLKDD